MWTPHDRTLGTSEKKGIWIPGQPPPRATPSSDMQTPALHCTTGGREAWIEAMEGSEWPSPIRKATP